MKKYLGIIKKEIFLTLLTGALLSLITSLLVLLPGYLIDNYKKGASFVVKLILIYFIVFLLYLLLSYLSNRISDYRRIKFERKLREDFFAKSIFASWEQFSKYKTGKYIFPCSQMI